MVTFIIIGLTSGAVYSLAGLGLVLTYKTSGVFNFAHGALAAVAAYVFYALYVLNHWSWPLAAAVAVLVAGPMMGLVLEMVARRLQGTSLTLRVASTVGLLLVIEATVNLIYGTDVVRTVPIFLGTANVRIAGANVQVAQIVTFAFSLGVTAALTAFFRFSRRGVAMRAVVDSPELLDLAGTNPAAVRRMAWMIGVTLAAASGVLFAPLLPLDPIQLTLLIVSAFGAAAIGAFTSLPLTLAGGLGIGVLAALSTKWFTTGVLSGLPPSLPFVVLFLVLMLFPKRYLVRRSYTVPRAHPAWRPPASLQVTGGGVLLLVLAFVPAFAGIHLTDWTTFIATAIVFMSLGLLVRTSGQVSLAHVTFAAIGATAFSHLTQGGGVPWPLALVLTGLIAMPIGALLAIPAVRLTGLYLALATFGFGILMQGMFYTESFMFGSNGVGVTDPRPHVSWLAGDTGFYYLVLVLAILVAGGIVGLNRSRLGRLLRGAADSSTALETSGASVYVTRVLVFCLAAFLAAIGGALAGVSQGTVVADSYQPLLSLTYFALIVIVVGGVPWDAILAAAALILVPSYVTGAHVTTVLQLLFGAGALGVAMLPGRLKGVPEAVQRAVDATFGRWLPRLPARAGRDGPGLRVTPLADETPLIRVAPDAPPAGGLTVDALKVTYGGLIALDGVSLTAPAGQISGLIGPNGAGKTTLFNVCSGLQRPAGGRVLLGGRDISHAGPAARARHGLGRTFQTVELFDSLTVRENVEAGAEAALAGANVLTHLGGRPGDARAIGAATDHALELCGLTTLAAAPAMSLATGQRRLVELARCLAGPFEVLLLDEPSSGLDRTETERFGEILRRVVAERGVGILLVEHDMSLVLDVCQRVYVLDFGELIFQGTPHELMRSDIVRAAYLGDASVEHAVTPGEQIGEVA